MEDFKLEQVSSFKFTKTQATTINSILIWLGDTSSYKPVTISGAAGTGKTTIVKEIVHHSCISNLVITAPTHKAVRVIKEVLGNRDSGTIQKLLGLRPNVNIERFDVNNPTFAMQGKQYILDYDFVIIDEASMLNTSLYKTIVDIAEDARIKVLFIGDSYQLPPVNEYISAAFTNGTQYELLEIVRQEKGNPLLELLAYARNDVKNKTNDFLTYIYTRPSKIVEGNGYHIFNSKDKEQSVVFQTQLVKALNVSKEQNNTNLAKYCAFTNNNIIDWNAYIRQNLINSDELLITGDILTGYNTIVDEFNSPYITNSEDYIVVDSTPYINTYGFKGYMVKLKNNFNGKETPYIFVLNHLDMETSISFLKIATTLIDTALSKPANQRYKAWQDYYEFKNKIFLLHTYLDRQNKPIVSKDLDYGYALTIHKTQGSTYGNIFINLVDILYQNGKVKTNVDIRNKLIYVALSRASKVGLLLV